MILCSHLQSAFDGRWLKRVLAALQLTTGYLFVSLMMQPVTTIAQAAGTGKSAVMHVTPTADFELTGDGREGAWGAATWQTLTYRGGEMKSYETKAKLLYSETGIYFLFHCADDQITSTLREDFADLYKEDVVEIFFWPDESAALYFEYELSPYNNELPILVPNFEGHFLGWRPWHYEGERLTRHMTSIDVTGWTAEGFIPFTLLEPLQNIHAKAGTRWRANLYRLDYDQGTTRWSWQPVRTNFHDYEMFGTLKFD